MQQRDCEVEAVMIKIIDSTLSKLDRFHVSKEQLLLVCEYMKQIGIENLEISINSYKKMETLPGGIKFYLELGPFDKASDYPGIYKYVIARENRESNIVSEFQINDVRELVLLKSYSTLSNVRIRGLDDLICHDYEYAFYEIKKIFNNSIINLCPENTFYCASAIAILWLISGGSEVTTSFAGCGNMAATEEVCMAMRVIERVKPNQKLEALISLREWYEAVTGEPISSRKPVIGSKIFYVESGIHVDGLLKKASNYEAYSPSIVGQKSTIVIGKYSGRNSIKSKCKEYGIENDALIPVILKEVKRVSTENRNSLSDEEFLDLVKRVIADG